MSEHPASLAIAALLADCGIERTRGSGPGGQHRNKVETAVRITHRPTGLRGEASERRSQETNRKTAVFRLRATLALEVRVAWEAPSALWAARSPGGKLAINPTHDDLPAILAESLDALARCDHDLGTAAVRLGVSSSQMVKLWKTQPRALEQVNRHRALAGLRPLR